MKSIRRLGVVLGAASLVLGTVTIGVGTLSATAASKFKACIVIDTGGVKDKSFNQSAWQGALDAVKANPNVSASYLTSTSSADYTPNINTFISKGCGLIVTVGFNMDSATAAAADAHPNQKFAIVDDAPQTTSHNVLALQYETDQAAFLGGYLDAATSKTGAVATYGGMAFSSVTMYMSGFVAGVRYYDMVNHKKVKVYGWTPSGVCSLTKCNGSGDFVGNFTSQTDGKNYAANYFSEGADIVFPVAGSVGLGSVVAAKQAGAGHQITWVDSNGCLTDPTDCKWYNATVAKGVEPSVRAAILAAAAGTFKGGVYHGTLANGGTLLEYNTTMASPALKATLAKIARGIERKTISIQPISYPATPN
jgi:basic membrane protein A and related proteins